MKGPIKTGALGEMTLEYACWVMKQHRKGITVEGLRGDEIGRAARIAAGKSILKNTIEEEPKKEPSKGFKRCCLCGKEFRIDRNRIYCSSTCSVEGGKKKDREYRRKRIE